MIPILQYGNTVVGFLRESTSCVVTEERNGIFELSMTYPVAGALFGEICIDRFVKAKPNDTADLQLFRIYEITKPMNGVVTVNAEHVSYALSSFPITDVSCTGTASQAVAAVLAKANAYLTSANPFTVGVTSADAIRSFFYRVGSARSALGGSEGSVLDTFGGEYEWDNYTVKLHEHRGTDTSVLVAYRKNVTDLKATTSLENAYTALFPYAVKDDALITIVGGIIPVENKSGIAERILIRDFSSDFDSDETVDASTLLAKANAFLNANDINAPDVSVTVSFIHLWQSPEYADIAALEKVSLCDWVTVRHDVLGVDVKAQVIKTEYDCIAERYVKIDLGSARTTFQDTMQKTIHDVTKLLQSTDTSAITQAYTQAIADATALITGADGGYVHLIPSQNPQEIVISDIEDFKSTAAKVWRWNKNGLGYSSTGYSGTYTTAITKDGKINAGMITTGTLNASIITAGVLQSADCKSSFNLENGMITTENILVTGGTIKIGSNDYYTYIANGSVEQYARGDGTLIGGIVPVSAGDTFAQSIFYDSTGSDCLNLACRNSDGNFESMMELNLNRISVYKDLHLHGLVYPNGNFCGHISFENGKGIKLHDEIALRYYDGAVAFGSSSSNIDIYSPKILPHTGASVSLGSDGNSFYDIYYKNAMYIMDSGSKSGLVMSTSKSGLVLGSYLDSPRVSFAQISGNNVGNYAVIAGNYARFNGTIYCTTDVIIGGRSLVSTLQSLGASGW